MPPDRKQSRAASLLEAITNVVVGFLLALLTQIAVFPLLKITVSTANHLLIGIIFTAVSIVRSFTLRRVFEAVRLRQAKRGAPKSTRGRSAVERYPDRV